MYLEQDDSMPAFIRDVKAYSQKQYEYHSQHIAAIRSLKAQNKYFLHKIQQLEHKIDNLISNNP